MTKITSQQKWSEKTERWPRDAISVQIAMESIILGFGSACKLPWRASYQSLDQCANCHGKHHTREQLYKWCVWSSVILYTEHLAWSSAHAMVSHITSASVGSQAGSLDDDAVCDQLPLECNKGACFDDCLVHPLGNSMLHIYTYVYICRVGPNRIWDFRLRIYNI